MNLDIGTQVGDYRILSRIGRGAYGTVFEAEHIITRRIDALKLMLDAGPSASDEEHRFLREIQVQASLQHPNIAQVYTAFRTPWGLALAMEMVNGEPLSNILRRGKPPLAEGAGYMLATLAGLSCTERMGIVHRDIKPDNILITAGGQVKITDFGLAQMRNCARITASGESLGTPCYMSPEQVTGIAPADARTDVYSCGVVLYEVVTGRPPFTGTNGFAVMLAHQNTAPVPPVEIEPATGPALNRVILKALEKDPARRFQNAAEFRNALEEAMSRREGIMMPAPMKNGSPSAKKMAAVAASAACLGGFLAWGTITTARKATPAAAAVVKPPMPAVPAAPELPSAPAPVTPSPDPTAVVSKPVRRPTPAAKPAAPTKPRFTPAQIEDRPQLPAPAIAEPPVVALPAKAPEAVPEVVPATVAAPAPVKKPNIVKRTLGRIFRRRGTENKEN